VISRLFITLALVSSLSCAAAQEAQPKESAKPKQKAFFAKHFSKVALTASVVATCVGLHRGHPGLTGCGFGLLTGLGCAVYESRPNSYPILAWIPELLVRHGIIRGAFLTLPEELIQHVLRGSRVGSWIGYVGYHIATAMDKEQKD
jgi:hypothetical protein